MYFEIRTKRLTVDERNTYKTVKELRLFEAESYTEAEEAIIKHLATNFKGEDYEVIRISVSKITAVEGGCTDELGYLWKVKVNEILEETPRGKLVKEPHLFLIRAENNEEVNAKINELISDWANPTEIVKVELTKFCDVIIKED